MLLAGVLLKLGTYGLLRFCLSLFPDAWALLAPGLAGWAAVSVLFGSLAAIAQTDMKRMVAYSSVGHMGYVLLAAAAATPISLLGSLLQMLAHGLISGLMFLLVGGDLPGNGHPGSERVAGPAQPPAGPALHRRIDDPGGHGQCGDSGHGWFCGGADGVPRQPAQLPVATLLSMVGSGLTAVYFLLLVNRAFFGRLATDAGGAPPALLPLAGLSKQVPAVVLAAAVVLMGLWPQGLANLAVASTNHLALGAPLLRPWPMATRDPAATDMAANSAPDPLSPCCSGC